MKDFTKDEINEVLKEAKKLEKIAKTGKSDILSGKILAIIFFEPSTRTRLSFETAMKRLGGDVLNLGNLEISSVAKGENLVDTIKVISKYSDAIVIRHPKQGAARLAAEYSEVPVINAGDGAGHHPTQTLLDLYTIMREKSLYNLKIAIIGDLKYGRTVHSLAYALSLYHANMSLVSPKELRMPENIKNDLKKQGAVITETDNIEDIIESMDVLYVTRIQKERFPDISEYQKVSGSYRITKELLKNANKNLIIMHPLPRIDEISPEVDNTKFAKYFDQAFYGIPVRMAILKMVIS